MEGRSRKNRKYSQTRRKTLSVLAVLAALLLAGGVWMLVKNGRGSRYDKNAVDLESIQRPVTKEQLRMQIQKSADESTFRLQMNASPTVKTVVGGSSSQTADWGIFNSIENPYNMQVTIALEDGTELYKSSQLKPGQHELTGTLEVPLAPGTYAAAATATAIDRETGDAIGTVSAELTLTVQAEEAQTQPISE